MQTLVWNVYKISFLSHLYGYFQGRPSQKLHRRESSGREGISQSWHGKIQLPSPSSNSSLVFMGMFYCSLRVVVTLVFSLEITEREELFMSSCAFCGDWIEACWVHPLIHEGFYEPGLTLLPSVSLSAGEVPRVSTVILASYQWLLTNTWKQVFPERCVTWKIFWQKIKETAQDASNAGPAC